MNCLHCGQALQDDTEDGAEVCRFCRPKFGTRRGKTGIYAPRCPACAEGRDHNPDDLEKCRLRLEYSPTP